MLDASWKRKAADVDQQLRLERGSLRGWRVPHLDECPMCATYVGQ